MENTEVNIPENIQEICRDFAEVAIKHGLYKFSGTFRPKEIWLADVSFNWEAGRHNEDSNQLKITSQFYVHTNVKLPK